MAPFRMECVLVVYAFGLAISALWIYNGGGRGKAPGSPSWVEVSGFRLGADFLCLLVQKPGYWGCHPDYGLVFGTNLQQKCGHSFQLLKGILADRIQPHIANSLLKPTA